MQSVKYGEVMAEVTVRVGEHQIVSAITRTAAESLGLEPGKEVIVVIKSTEVMIATP